MTKEQLLFYGEVKEEIPPSNSIAIFIDGPYLAKAANRLGLRDRNTDFNFSKMLTFLTGGRKCVAAIYYTGLTFSRSAEPFFHKIEQFGYQVVEASENPVTGKPPPVDHMLITDLCLSKDQWETACIVSGDGDFAYPIERLVKDFNKKVEIVAARGNTSRDLLQLAERYPSNIQIVFLDTCYPNFTMRRVPKKA